MTTSQYIGGGGPVAIVKTTMSAGSALASSHSIDMDTGAMFSNKAVACIVNYAGTSGGRVSSSTIGGVVAPVMRQEALVPGDPFGDFGTAIIGAKVTSPAATQTIGLTASGGGIQIYRIALYVLRGLVSITPIGTDGGVTATSGTVDGLTKTVSAQKDGIVLAGITSMNTNAGSFTIGLTQDYDGSSEQYAGGHSLIAADDATYDVRYARSGAPSAYFSLSVVSLR